MIEQDFSSTPRKARIRYPKGNADGDTPPSQSLELQDSPKKPSTPVAVFLCHGMGQQVRFETVGQIAGAILKYAEGQGCVLDDTGVQLSFHNESLLARAELNWALKGKPHSVHIYEAYWAPVTEGKVTYWDTVKFLFSAAYKGIRSSSFFKSCTFERYLFGAVRELEIERKAKGSLLLVTAVLLAQVIFIAVVTAKLVDQLKQIETAHFAVKQVLEVALPGLDNILGPSSSPWQRLISLLKIVGWYAVVAESLFVRYFLIQYAGDVAAYISPYKDSKFEEIRSKIQTIGLNVAKVVYGLSGSSSVPCYERIVFAGHSLGSVVAYDTLNAVINLDLTSATPGSARAAERTSKLITFGSPLDKTAFLFRNQSNHLKDPLREQMVNAFQPLVLNYSENLIFGPISGARGTLFQGAWNTTTSQFLRRASRRRLLIL